MTNQILTKEEKEYLSNFIKPFKSRVQYIKRHYWPYHVDEEFPTKDPGEEYLVVVVKILGQEKLGLCRDVILPNYEIGKYYQGMEKYRKYTLEELGLWKEQYIY